jgi:defect-in-organelle-trafficking protein DotC
VLSCTKNNDTFVGNTETLEGLQEMANNDPKKLMDQSGSKIRGKAVEDAGLSIGAQSGLAYRAKDIDSALVRIDRTLDLLYDFNAIMLENNVLPPVLQEGQELLNMPNSQALRLTDRTYRILAQARFVTTVPNWRQYLWLDYHLPEKPHPSVLPKTDEERKIWQESVAKGWQKGMQQADNIFRTNQARLKQDYLGMVLYRKLLAQNIVSQPYVSKVELGITGDGNQINIDDRVLRIAALPALKPDSREWRSALSQQSSALKEFKRIEKVASSTKLIVTDNAWQPIVAAVQD